MATVPLAQVRTQTEATPFVPQQNPGVDFDIASKGIAMAGKALGNASDVSYDIILKGQIQDNERQAKDLDVQFSQAVSQAVYGDENNPGYYATNGEASIAGYAPTRQSISQIRARLLKGITNPAVRDMVEAATAQTMQSEFNNMSRFVTGERQKANVNSSQARVAQASNDAIARWNDPVAIQLFMTKLNAEAAAQKNIMGWDDDLTQQYISAERSKTLTGVISRAAADSAAAGEQVYAQYKNQIDGSFQPDIEQVLDRAKKSEQAEAEHRLYMQRQAQEIAQAQTYHDFSVRLADPDPSKRPTFKELAGANLSGPQFNQLVDALNADVNKGYSDNADKYIDMVIQGNAPPLAEFSKTNPIEGDAKIKLDNWIRGRASDAPSPEWEAMSQQIALGNLPSREALASAKITPEQRLRITNMLDEADKAGTGPVFRSLMIGVISGTIKDQSQLFELGATLPGSALKTLNDEMESRAKEKERLQNEQDARISQSIYDQLTRGIYQRDPTITPAYIDNSGLSGDRLTVLHKLYDQQNSIDSPEDLSRRTTNALFARIAVAAGTPGKLTDTSEIVKSKSYLSNADYNWLIEQFNNYNGPDGSNFGSSVKSFLDGQKEKVTGSLLGSLPDPLGQEEWYLYNRYVTDKIAEYRKANKDPNLLFQPGKPDYLGSPEVMQQFVKPMQDRLNAAFNSAGGYVDPVTNETITTPPSSVTQKTADTYTFTNPTQLYNDMTSGVLSREEGKKVYNKYVAKQE